MSMNNVVPVLGGTVWFLRWHVCVLLVYLLAGWIEPCTVAMPGARGHRRWEMSASFKGSSSAKRRKSVAANTEDPPFVDKERPASKLSVSAHGRAALPSTAPNLNIGMDPWSTSPCSLGQGEVNAAASSQSNAPLSQMVEQELKRERRKQSNKESARRSRLRKQGKLLSMKNLRSSWKLKDLSSGSWSRTAGLYTPHINLKEVVHYVCLLDAVFCEIYTSSFRNKRLACL